MKRRIRLTESDLHRIVKEAVRRTITEITDDTIYSARQKSLDKLITLNQQYGEYDPRTQHARDQYDFFRKSWDDEYDQGNTARKAKMKQRAYDQRYGKRRYVSGKGWRNEE